MWLATYASVIPDDIHVKLVGLSTDNAPCVDVNDPDDRIITLYPFYILGILYHGVCSNSLYSECLLSDLVL